MIQFVQFEISNLWQNESVTNHPELVEPIVSVRLVAQGRALHITTPKYSFFIRVSVPGYVMQQGLFELEAGLAGCWWSVVIFMQRVRLLREGRNWVAGNVLFSLQLQRQKQVLYELVFFPVKWRRHTMGVDRWENTLEMNVERNYFEDLIWYLRHKKSWKIVLHGSQLKWHKRILLKFPILKSSYIICCENTKLIY